MLMPYCGVHDLWFAFVCVLIGSQPPPPPKTVEGTGVQSVSTVHGICLSVSSWVQLDVARSTVPE